MDLCIKFLLGFGFKNEVIKHYTALLTLVEIHSRERSTLLPYLQSIIM